MLTELLNHLGTNAGKRSLILVACGAIGATIGPPVMSFVFGGFFAAAQEYASFPMNVQRIEWIRREVRQVPCGLAAVPFQALLNEATAWDLRITHEQESNRHWWSDYLSTNQWNRVALIALPCEELHD